MVTETHKYEVVVLNLVYWDSYCVLGHGPTLICKNPPSYLGHRNSDASTESVNKSETLDDSGQLEIASENQYEIICDENEKQIKKDEVENETQPVSEELKKDDQYEKCEIEGTDSNKLDGRQKTEFEQTIESKKQYDSLRSKRKVFIEITVKHYSIEGDQLVEYVPQKGLSRTQSLDTNRSTWNVHSCKENFAKLAVNHRYMDPRPENASVIPFEESQMTSEIGQSGSDLTSYYSNERLSTTFDSLSDDVFETESQTEARRELMGFVLHRTKKKSNLLEDISPEKVSYDLPESPENTDCHKSDEDDAANVRDVSDDDSESIDAYKVIDEAFADILSFDSFSTQFTESSDNMSLWSLTEYDNQVDRVERFVCISDRECFDYSAIQKDDTLVEDLNSTDTLKSDIVESDYNEHEIDTIAEIDLSDNRKEETVEIDENAESKITGKGVNDLKYIGDNVTKDKGDIEPALFENNNTDHDDALDHMVGDVTHERNFDIKNENILNVKHETVDNEIEIQEKMPESNIDNNVNTNEMETNFDKNENKQIISRSSQKIPKLEINNSSFKDESESDEVEGEELQVSVDFEIHVRVDLGSSRCSSPVSSRFGSTENINAIDNSHLMVNAVDIGDALDFEAVTGEKDNIMNLRLQQEAAERIARDIADRVLRESKSLVAQSAEKAISNRRRGSSQYEDRGMEDIVEENILCTSDRNESVEGQFNQQEGGDKLTDVSDLFSDHLADIVSDNRSNAKCHADVADVGEVVTFVTRERYATDIVNPVSDADTKVEQLEWSQNDEDIDTVTVKGNTKTNIHDQKFSVDASYKGAIIETPNETPADIPDISVHTETDISELRSHKFVRETPEFPIDKSVQTEYQAMNIQCDLMELVNQNQRETVSGTIVEEPSVTEFPSKAEITYNIPEMLVRGHEVCSKTDIHTILHDDKYTCEQISELHDDGAILNDNDDQKRDFSDYGINSVEPQKPDSTDNQEIVAEINITDIKDNLHETALHEPVANVEQETGQSDKVIGSMNEGEKWCKISSETDIPNDIIGNVPIQVSRTDELMQQVSSNTTCLKNTLQKLETANEIAVDGTDVISDQSGEITDDMIENSDAQNHLDSTANESFNGIVKQETELSGNIISNRDIEDNVIDTSNNIHVVTVEQETKFSVHITGNANKIETVSISHEESIVNVESKEETFDFGIANLVEKDVLPETHVVGKDIKREFSDNYTSSLDEMETFSINVGDEFLATDNIKAQSSNFREEKETVFETEIGGAVRNVGKDTKEQMSETSVEERIITVEAECTSLDLSIKDVDKTKYEEAESDKLKNVLQSSIDEHNNGELEVENDDVAIEKVTESDTKHETSYDRLGFCESDAETQCTMQESANIVKTETMSDHDTTLYETSVDARLETVDHGSSVDKRNSLEDMAFATELKAELGERDQEVGSSVDFISDMNSAERLQIMHILYIWTKKHDTRSNLDNMETAGDVNYISLDEGSSVDNINIEDKMETVSDSSDDENNKTENEVTEFKTAVNETEIALDEEAGTSVDINSITDDGHTQFVTAVDTQFAYLDNEEGTSIDVASIVGETEHDLDTSVDAFCVTLDQDASLSVDDISIIDSTENDFEIAVFELDDTADQAIKLQENVCAHLNQKGNMVIASEDDSAINVENETALSDDEIISEFEKIETLEDEHGYTVQQEKEYINVVIADLEKTTHNLAVFEPNAVVEPLSSENGSEGNVVELEGEQGPQSAIDTLPDELFGESSKSIYNEDLMETTPEVSVYELAVENETLSAEVASDMNQIEIVPDVDSSLVDQKGISAVSQLDKDTDLHDLNTDSLQCVSVIADLDKEKFDKEMYFKDENNRLFEIISETEEKTVDESVTTIKEICINDESQILGGIMDHTEKEAIDRATRETDNDMQVDEHVASTIKCSNKLDHADTADEIERTPADESFISASQCSDLPEHVQDSGEKESNLSDGESDFNDIADNTNNISKNESACLQNDLNDETEIPNDESQHIEGHVSETSNDVKDSEETPQVIVASQHGRQEREVRDSSSVEIETSESGAEEDVIADEADGKSVISHRSHEIAPINEPSQIVWQETKVVDHESGHIAATDDRSIISQDSEETTQMNDPILTEQQEIKEQESASGHIENAKSVDERAVVTYTARDKSIIEQDSEKVNQMNETFLPERPETEEQNRASGHVKTTESGSQEAFGKDAAGDNSIFSKDFKNYTHINETSLPERQETEVYESSQIETAELRVEEPVFTDDKSIISQDSEETTQMHDEDADVMDKAAAESIISQDSDETSQIKERSLSECQETDKQGSKSGQIETAYSAAEKDIITDAADEMSIIEQDSEKVYQTNETFLPERPEMEEQNRASGHVKTTESGSQEALGNDAAGDNSIFSKDFKNNTQINETYLPERQETEVCESSQIETAELRVEEPVFTDDKSIISQDSEETTQMHDDDADVMDKAAAESIISQDSDETSQIKERSLSECQETDKRGSKSGQIETAYSAAEKDVITDAADEMSIISKVSEESTEMNEQSESERQEMEELDSASGHIEIAESGGEKAVISCAPRDAPGQMKTADSGVKEAVVTDTADDQFIMSKGIEESSFLNELFQPEWQGPEVRDSESCQIETAETGVQKAVVTNTAEAKVNISQDPDTIKEHSLSECQVTEVQDSASGEIETSDSGVGEAVITDTADDKSIISQVSEEISRIKKPSFSEHQEEQERTSGHISTAVSDDENAVVTDKTDAEITIRPDSDDTSQTKEHSLSACQEKEVQKSASILRESAEIGDQEAVVFDTGDTESIISQDSDKTSKINEQSLSECQETEVSHNASSQVETAESGVEDVVVTDTTDAVFTFYHCSEETSHISLSKHQETEVQDSAYGLIETVELAVDDNGFNDVTDVKSIISQDSDDTTQMPEPSLPEQQEMEELECTTGDIEEELDSASCHIKTAESGVEEDFVFNTADAEITINQNSEETSKVDELFLPEPQETEVCASCEIETAEPEVEEDVVTDTANDKFATSQGSEKTFQLNVPHLTEQREMADLESVAGHMETAESEDKRDIVTICQDSEETSQINELSIAELQEVQECASGHVETAESGVAKAVLTDAEDDQDSEETSQMHEPSLPERKEMEELESAAGHDVDNSTARDMSIISQDLEEANQIHEPLLEHQETEVLNSASVHIKTADTGVKEAVGTGTADAEPILRQQSDETSQINEHSLSEHQETEVRDSASGQIETAASGDKDVFVTDTADAGFAISQDSEETTQIKELSLAEHQETQVRDSASGLVEMAESAFEEVVVADVGDGKFILCQDLEETSQINELSLPECQEPELRDSECAVVEAAELGVGEAVPSDSADDKSNTSQDSEDTTRMQEPSLSERQETEVLTSAFLEMISQEPEGTSQNDESFIPERQETEARHNESAEIETAASGVVEAVVTDTMDVGSIISQDSEENSQINVPSLSERQETEEQDSASTAESRTEEPYVADTADAKFSFNQDLEETSRTNELSLPEHQEAEVRDSESGEMETAELEVEDDGFNDAACGKSIISQDSDDTNQKFVRSLPEQDEIEELESASSHIEIAKSEDERAVVICTSDDKSINGQDSEEANQMHQPLLPERKDTEVLNRESVEIKAAESGVEETVVTDTAGDKFIISHDTEGTSQNNNSSLPERQETKVQNIESAEIGTKDAESIISQDSEETSQINEPLERQETDKQESGNGLVETAESRDEDAVVTASDESIFRQHSEETTQIDEPSLPEIHEIEELDSESCNIEKELESAYGHNKPAESGLEGAAVLDASDGKSIFNQDSEETTQMNEPSQLEQQEIGVLEIDSSHIETEKSGGEEAFATDAADSKSTFSQDPEETTKINELFLPNRQEMEEQDSASGHIETAESRVEEATVTNAADDKSVICQDSEETSQMNEPSLPEQEEIEELDIACVQIKTAELRDESAAVRYTADDKSTESEDLEEVTQMNDPSQPERPETEELQSTFVNDAADDTSMFNQDSEMTSQINVPSLPEWQEVEVPDGESGQIKKPESKDEKYIIIDNVDDKAVQESEPSLPEFQEFEPQDDKTAQIKTLETGDERIDGAYTADYNLRISQDTKETTNMDEPTQSEQQERLVLESASCTIETAESEADANDLADDKSMISQEFDETLQINQVSQPEWQEMEFIGSASSKSERDGPTVEESVVNDVAESNSILSKDLEEDTEINEPTILVKQETEVEDTESGQIETAESENKRVDVTYTDDDKSTISEDPEIITQKNEPSLKESQEMEELVSASSQIETAGSGVEESVVTDASDGNCIINQNLEETTKINESSQPEQLETEVLKSAAGPIETAEIVCELHQEPVISEVPETECANVDIADGEHQTELPEINDTTSDICETIKDGDEVIGADSVSTFVCGQEQLTELVPDTGSLQDLEDIDIEKDEIHKTTNVEQSNECEEIEHDFIPQDIQLNDFKKDRMLGKKSSSFDIVETEIYSRNQIEEQQRLDWRRNRAKSLGHIFKSKLQEDISKRQAYNSLNRKSSFLHSENPVEDRNSKRVTSRTKSTELTEDADAISNVKGHQRRRSVDLSHYGAISGLSAVEIDFEEFRVEEEERIDSPVDPNMVKQKLEELLKSERRNSLQKETERFNRGAIVDKSFDNEKNESPKFKKHRRERYKDNGKSAVDDLWLRVGGSRDDFLSAQYKNYRSFEGDDGPLGRHNRNSSDGQIHVQKTRSRKNSDGQINVQKTSSRHSSQEEADSVGSPRGQKADYIEIKKFIKEKDKRARKANFLTSAQLRKFSEPKPSVNLNFGPVEMVSLNIDRQLVKDSSESQYTRKKEDPLTSDLQKRLERDIEVFEGDSLQLRQNINLQDEEQETFDVYRYEKHKQKGKRSDHNSEIERKKQDQSYYDNNSVKKSEFRVKKHVHSELNSRHVNWQNIGVLESQSSVSHGLDQYAQNRCLEKHDPSLSCKVVTSHFNQGNGEAFYQQQSDPDYVHGQSKYQQELNVRKKNSKNGNCEKDYYRHRMKIPVSSRETSVDGPLSLTDTFAPMDRGHSTENQNSSNHNLSQSTGKLTDSTTSLNNRQAPAKSPSRQNTLAKQSSIQSSTSELNGEGREEAHGIKFERLKNLEEDELMVKVKEIIGHLDKLEDYHRGDGMRIQKMLGDMYWDYTHLREMIADCMAENGYAVVSMKMLKNLNSIGIFKNDDVWFPTYYTYNTMWNFSDASPNLAKALSENDAVRLLTLNCGHKPYINALHSKNVFYVIKASLSILHNIARNSGMKHLFDENKTSETIMPFLQSEDEMLKILATLTIANIVDEEENKTVIAESGTIHSIVSWIEKAISLPRRRFKGFTPQELTEGLNKLAVNDSNKMRIVEEGGIPLFLLMLQHEDVREQSSAARIIWTLSFDKEVRQNLLESNDLISTLEKLTGSTNKSVQQNANGSLWIIKGENDISRETKPKGKPTNTHVFLSYSWSDKDTVLQIRDRLRAEGYAIWIDIEKGSAATLESMAHAVENAAVVLICMSEKYKQNPNCRTESEYTFQLKKDYIPLMLQKKYRPDGWLGTILGAKLYFDFSGKYPFDKSFTGLLKELRGRGQVTPNTTPGGSSDTTEGALVTSQSLKSLASPGTPVPSNSVLMHMGQEELVKWLRNVKLTECIPAFLEFDGRLLLQLKQMRVEAPEFFYQCLEKRLNMSLIEILKFTRALEELH